ncbi:MAG: META domain-containing protein [Alistipes sp.]|jgi:heat shock protein HslJ|nr:META domain-containing protein [Alistipes sp.]
MKTTKFVTAMALVMAALSVGFSSCCGCGKSRSAVALDGAEWHLIQLNGGGVESDNYRVTFGADGRVAGVGECNRFSGTFTRTGNVIEIADNLVSTRMMCLNGAEREAAFLAMLARVDGLSIDGDRLLLISDGDVRAIFEAMPLAEAPAKVPAEAN